MSQILLVEDDPQINQMEQTLLRKKGYNVISAFSGTEALLWLDKSNFDLVILDLMLPGLSGKEVLAKIRQKQDIVVLCVSAIDVMDTKVEMIREGADDYLTKPFHNEEFLVRIEALLRRNHGRTVNNRILTFKDITLDNENHVVSVNGKQLILTAKEFAILELMMQNPKKVFTKDNIYESVWQEAYLPEDNAVNVHISNLRSKLAEANKEETYIKTIWGIGFKLSEE